MRREKRVFERIDSLIDVRYKGMTDDIRGYSLTKDVSEGGMGLPVNGRIQSGTLLELEIILERLKRKIEMAAVVKVVWSRRNAEHWMPRYSAGLKFVEISPSDKDALVNYARENRWIKGDFERSLEENKIPVLGKRGEFAI